MEELLEELKLIKDKPVIVEGINDVKALEELGFTNVTPLNGALYQVIERFEDEDEVVILTDLDKEGKKIYGRLAKGFAKRGVKVNDNVRNILFKETKLRQIEGLANYIKRNQ